MVRGMEQALYLVVIEPDPGLRGLVPEPALRRLAPGLYLVASGQGRAPLYHAVKRLTRPDRLLVAPLAGDPKFKGMEAGALAWLRSRAGAAADLQSSCPGPDGPLSAPAKPAARSPARHRR